MEKHDKERATAQAGDDAEPAAKRAKTSAHPGDDGLKTPRHGVAPIKAEFVYPHLLPLLSASIHPHLLTRQMPHLAH